MMLTRKDLLGIKELSLEEINLILDTAAGFKDVLGRDIKKVPTLRGKTTVNLFFEPSNLVPRLSAKQTNGIRTMVSKRRILGGAVFIGKFCRTIKGVPRRNGQQRHRAGRCPALAPVTGSAGYSSFPR